MMGFSSGEINRKVRVGPKPALAESSPLSMGMVEQLQKQLAIPASTLSHHIAALVSVGLVKQNRESRTLLCVSQYEVLEEIIAFFRDECCVNSPGS
ncbi:helix-turn-helix domain-containing protein [Aeromonas sp.]|uniref:ArsR/SmtB family transcription factor n=1 Tax=Aeromonas sp. TaxID=647 RepID=UPI00338DAEAB